ncbi:MAG: plastocyanin/azurin family copper-binding protein [Haloarculaceae archaeon]
MIERRAFLQTTGALAVGAALAGCSGEQDDDEADDTEESPTTEAEETPESSVTEVAVGPEGRLRFDPDEVEISVGDTVRWEAMSAGHNVTSHPDASPKCENPEGADPFTSYEGDSHFSIMDVGETFEHEFTIPGEYVYVCTPHAGQGMVGTVIVSE